MKKTSLSGRSKNKRRRRSGRRGAPAAGIRLLRHFARERSASACAQTLQPLSNDGGWKVMQ
jgi:hypothetical protein